MRIFSPREKSDDHFGRNLENSSDMKNEKNKEERERRHEFQSFISRKREKILVFAFSGEHH